MNAITDKKSWQINHNLVTKLENIYRKEIESANAIAPVIREIIAYQVNDSDKVTYPVGEFDPDKISTQSYHANLNQIKNETESLVINRMIEYIDELAMHAANIHVNDNFLNPENYAYPSLKTPSVTAKSNLYPFFYLPFFKKDTDNKISFASQSVPIMDVKKTNQITRLSLNEFSLYPNEKRGPLTLSGYNQFLQRVIQIAQKCPENLHLLLATVPVLFPDKNVSNFAVYIQCGANPILTSFAKNYSSEYDPVYPNTENRDSKSSPDKSDQDLINELINFIISIDKYNQSSHHMMSLKVIKNLHSKLKKHHYVSADKEDVQITCRY